MAGWLLVEVFCGDKGTYFDWITRVNELGSKKQQL